MTIMREASVILPDPDTMGAHAIRQGNIYLKKELVSHFGGYTVHKAQGAWRDNDGQIVYDDNMIYTIAMDDTAENRHRLQQVAISAGVIAEQDTIYVRLPSGDVELHPAMLSLTYGRAA
jgi:hypothetical protein